MFRDREGKQIDLMAWADRFQDLDYRIIRDDIVVPVPFHVCTVWEGIESLVGCMFATGVRRLLTGEDWSPFVTFAETPTEHDALHAHDRIVEAIRDGSMPLAWSEVAWRLDNSPRLVTQLS